jgi:DNA-binding transcriptional MerR regulator
MKKTQLLISELAKRAGVSVRTIRYYIKEGLLPSPRSRGRYSVYDEDYLFRLELIKRLKQAYLPLKEIRVQLSELTPEDIRTLLASEDLPGVDTDKASKSKIGEAHPPTLSLDAGLEPQKTIPEVVSPSMASPELRQEPPSDALGYITRILETVPKSKPRRGKKRHRPARQQPQPRAKKPLPSPAAPVGQGEAWRRIVLAPGIELHIQQKQYKRFTKKVKALISHAEDYFNPQETEEK